MRACIGLRCRKEQVTAEAEYLMRSCLFLCTFLCTPRAGCVVVGLILNPRLWVILWLLEVFWKALDLEVPTGHGPGISAPKTRLLRGCRALIFWLCRTPVANQVRHQRLARIDMS